MNLSQILEAVRGVLSTEQPDTDDSAETVSEPVRRPTRLYCCPECDRTYISDEMETCPRCETALERTQTEHDLSLSNRH